MKFGNVQKKYVSYTMTFQHLHIPMLALAQLYVAYWRVFIQNSVNYKLGMPKTFVYGVFHFLVAMIFLVLAIVSGKSFRVTLRSVPFIIIWGIVHVSVAAHFFSRAQTENGPFIAAWYQPFAPAFTSCIAFFMGYEKPTKLKITGLSLWFGAVWSRLIYDLNSDVYYKTDQFRGKFFILSNIIFYAIGVLIQK